jgi:dienelactone hydrolase
MRVLTNSHRGAPYDVQIGAPQILIYCHGLISFASENTTLMEHLASHGFVVMSLQHLDQLAELRALQTSQTKEVKKEQSRIEREIKSAQRDKRAELWKKYFRTASVTNRIVSGRSADIQHAASKIGTVLNKIPKIDAAPARIVGAIGLSLGGAVATEFSKAPGSQIRCVVNLDGGNYGELQDEPIRIPYLMLYSEENEGTNDVALNAVNGIEVAGCALPKTRHLNLHDISMVYPVMKWMGAIGSADPAFAIHRRNEVVHEFVCRAAV